MSNQNNSNVSKIIKCQFCKSTNYVLWGKRKTEKRGIIQTYKCKDCNKRFTNDNGYYRMKNNENIITTSINMYKSKLSSRKMRNQLKRQMETKISHVTILDWARKYVKNNKYSSRF